MKIIYLVPTNVYSGAENITLLLAKHLAGKHQVFYASPDGPIEVYLKEAKVQHISISKMSIKEVIRIYKEIQPDVFHAVDFRTSTYCAIAGVPFVAHLHQNPLWLQKLTINSLAMLFFSCRAKKVICISESIINEYVFSNLIRHKVIVIENVVDSDRVLKQAGGSMVCNKQFDIGFVGRLEKEKDPLRFIKIAHKIIQEREIKAIVIGDGSLKEDVENVIRENNLENNIIMTGFLKNPYKEIAKIKIIIMPSIWEGFGLVAVEGMLLGCPVLGTRVGGLQKVIGVENKNICENDEQFIQRIKELANDHKEWLKCSEEVKTRAMCFCVVEKYIDKIEKIYLNTRQEREL